MRANVMSSAGSYSAAVWQCWCLSSHWKQHPRKFQWRKTHCFDCRGVIQMIIQSKRWFVHCAKFALNCTAAVALFGGGGEMHYCRWKEKLIVPGVYYLSSLLFLIGRAFWHRRRGMNSWFVRKEMLKRWWGKEKRAANAVHSSDKGHSNTAIKRPRGEPKKVH